MKITKIIFAGGLIGFLIGLIVQQIRIHKLHKTLNNWNDEMDNLIEQIEKDINAES